MGYTTEFSGRFEASRKFSIIESRTLSEFSEERHGNNTSHAGYPSFWCDWAPSEDDNAIEWNGNEKFYGYVEWLHIIINRFLTPWNIMLNGEVTWAGEESDDLGKIIVKDNIVTVKYGQVQYD